MKRFLTFAIATVALMASTSAQADIICRGPVNYTVVLNNGALSVDWGFGPIYVCWTGSSNASNEIVIPMQSCSAIMSQALTSLATGKDFGAYFRGVNSCANIRGSNGWGAPQPDQFYLFK